MIYFIDAFRFYQGCLETDKIVNVQSLEDGLARAKELFKWRPWIYLITFNTDDKHTHSLHKGDEQWRPQ